MAIAFGWRSGFAFVAIFIALGGFALELPFHLAHEGNVALVDLDVHGVLGERRIVREDGERLFSQSLVGNRIAQQLDRDLIDDRLDAFDPGSGGFGRLLFPEGGHVAGECYHPLARRYADMGGRDARLPFELVHHRLLQQRVLGHGRSPNQCARPNRPVAPRLFGAVVGRLDLHQRAAPPPGAALRRWHERGRPALAALGHQLRQRHCRAAKPGIGGLDRRDRY